MNVQPLLLLTMTFAALACKAQYGQSAESRGAAKNKPGGPSEIPAWASGINFNIIPPQDLKIGNNLKVMSPADVSAEMADSDQYFAEAPSSESDSCSQELMSEARLKATKQTITADFEVDLASCLGDDQTTYQTAKLGIKSVIACENGDVSQLNGKVVPKVQKLTCADGEMLMVTWLRMIISSTTQTEAGVSEVRGPSISTKSMPDGTPCLAEISGNSVTWRDGCQELSSDLITYTVNGKADPSSGLQNVHARVFKQLVAPKQTRPGMWYASGSMTTNLNNWKGVVTFKGVNNAPSYNLTSDRGAPLNGVLGTSGAPVDDAGLRLTTAPRSPQEKVAARVAKLQRHVNQAMGLR